MKISNQGGWEQNNVMFIDALWSIAPHQVKQAIDKNKYKIVQNAKQQFTKIQNSKIAIITKYRNCKIAKLTNHNTDKSQN